MPDDTPLSVPYPAIARKKVTAAFDGGRLSSDSGVMLLSLAERRRGIAKTLAALIADPRDPAHVTHTVEDVLKARIFAIACGYPDGNDLNWLRSDPAFKLACGRLPETGADLCSQPTVSRWENAPTLREIVRLTYALIDIWCRSYAKPPVSVVLDIDDTLDVAHGHQEMAEWNAHYDERCFLPIHIYDTATGRPVTMILRPGKTPSGAEVRRWLRRLIKRIRQHWPKTHIVIRGDGHYGRDEAMSWCEDNGVDYIFGFGGNTVLDRLVEVEADDIRTRRAEGKLAVLRGYAETRYGAKSWTRERRVAARIEAKESDEDDMLRRGIDIRYVVTSLKNGNAEHLYGTVYCARGQAENLIKQHKAQTASDRTSCRSPLANQFRLILHTAAYWLLLDVRDHVPSWHPLRQSEFASIRLHLLKVAGRFVETASRIRVALASCCPEAGLFGLVAFWLQQSGP
ncbi:MAG: IS1380 family transposase [Terracidiphilus sp.]